MGNALARGEKEVTLQAPEVGVMGMIERLASDPNFDTAKLEKLVELHERSLARDAKLAFYAALTAAQMEMRPIAADATNPQTRSRYATYAALDNKLRPIYTRHGFGLSFNTADSPLPEHVRVLCSVTHSLGHDQPYQVDMPCDGKGAKGGDVMTKTHAAGAAMSYGMRYLLKMIFNVSVGEDDRDGNEPESPVEHPPGFEDRYMDLEIVAENGTAALHAAWKALPENFRTHVFKHYRRDWEALKAKAAKVGKA